MPSRKRGSQKRLPHVMNHTSFKPKWIEVSNFGSSSIVRQQLFQINFLRSLHVRDVHRSETHKPWWINLKLPWKSKTLWLWDMATQVRWIHLMSHNVIKTSLLWEFPVCANMIAHFLNDLNKKGKGIFKKITTKVSDVLMSNTWKCYNPAKMHDSNTNACCAIVSVTHRNTLRQWQTRCLYVNATDKRITSMADKTSMPLTK